MVTREKNDLPSHDPRLRVRKDFRDPDQFDPLLQHTITMDDFRNIARLLSAGTTPQQIVASQLGTQLELELSDVEDAKLMMKHGLLEEKENAMSLTESQLKRHIRKHVRGALAEALALEENKKSSPASPGKGASGRAFWDLVELAGWTGRGPDALSGPAGRLAKVLKTDRSRRRFEQLYRAHHRILYNRLNDWEREQEDLGDPKDFNTGDDGFSDLISHIIGLGRSEYQAAMKDPMVAYERARARDYYESFSYVFHELLPYKPK
jgi:hypothetical protein